MEGKVFQWNWYLQEFLRDRDVVAKGSVPSLTEELAQFPLTEIPKPLTPPQKEAPLGRWGPMERSHVLANTWPTDGMATSNDAQTHWKASA